MIAGHPVAMAAGIVLIALFLLLCLAVLWRAGRSRQRSEAEAAARAAELESHVNSLLSAQSEMTGRMQAMAELLGGGQAEMSKALSERLDGMTHRLNKSMGEATKNTHENLKQLHERLAVLDVAQPNITDLTGQVTTLSNILANKQSRGAFGQGRMEAIVSDGLPPGAFAFQFTLRSGQRPDCVIHLPNGAPPLVIDAKFPLEAYNALKAAETPEALKSARQQFRGDLARHVKDIREKYLVPGETHDTAFMFVPSESVFAEIHEAFDDIVQSAYRSRIVIVSPTHLPLVDPGHPGGAARPEVPRAGARDPGRGEEDDARRGPPGRARAQPRRPFRRGAEGHRADPHLDREGDQAGSRYRRDRGGGATRRAAASGERAGCGASFPRN